MEANPIFRIRLRHKTRLPKPHWWKASSHSKRISSTTLSSYGQTPTGSCGLNFNPTTKPTLEVFRNPPRNDQSLPRFPVVLGAVSSSRPIDSLKGLLREMANAELRFPDGRPRRQVVYTLAMTNENCGLEVEFTQIPVTGEPRGLGLPTPCLNLSTAAFHAGGRYDLSHPEAFRANLHRCLQNAS